MKQVLLFTLVKFIGLIPRYASFPTLLRLRNDLKNECLREQGYQIGVNCRINGVLDSVNPTSIHIGDYVVLGANSVILAHCLLSKKKEVVIESSVFVGWGAIVLPGVTIKEGSVIGAGAVVTKDVPPYSLVVGNPAKVIRTLDERFANELREALQSGRQIGKQLAEDNSCELNGVVD